MDVGCHILDRLDMLCGFLPCPLLPCTVLSASQHTVTHTTPSYTRKENDLPGALGGTRPLREVQGSASNVASKGVHRVEDSVVMSARLGGTGALFSGLWAFKGDALRLQLCSCSEPVAPQPLALRFWLG